VKDYVEVDTFDVVCRPGDRFVLCSDGVHGYVENEADLGRLASPPDTALAARALVEFAIRKGGRDNATAIVVDVLPADTTENLVRQANDPFGDIETDIDPDGS
jgi:serine/threonine protein phosphatase PrpC